MLLRMLVFWVVTDTNVSEVHAVSTCFQYRIFGPKREEVTKHWRKLQRASSFVCTAHSVLSGSSHQGKRDRQACR
jgi:hypothetical protein